MFKFKLYLSRLGINYPQDDQFSDLLQGDYCLNDIHPAGF